MKGMQRFGMVMGIAAGLATGLAVVEPVRADTLTIGAAYSLKSAFPEVVPMFKCAFGATV